MPILAPFEAFARDAVALKVDEDESRLPVKWLAAAQIAARLADSRPAERKALLGTWIRQQKEDGADGIWSVLAVPGLPVQDLPSASAALCHMAADMERGGALNLAYSTVTHMRISMLERGPAAARGLATLQQGRILRQMGLLEEAEDTFEEAREDGVRAQNSEIEGRAYIGLGGVYGQRGNYPAMRTAGERGLTMLPPGCVYIAVAHNDLMIAAKALSDFAQAFEHGWKAFDASENDMERRLGVISNMASLALRTARFSAARRGFLHVLGMTKLERIVLPSLGGLALTCAATRDLSELQRVAKTIDLRSASGQHPYEIARVRFDLAQAWQETAQLDKAAESLSSARDIARAHGFHEVAFKSDLLADALTAASTQRARDERVEVSIARFEELSADEHVLVGA